MANHEVEAGKEPLPPLSVEGRLAVGGAMVCFALLLVPAVGIPRLQIFCAPLLAYFFLLAVGLWRVRPSPGRRIAFAVCSFFCLLKVAVYILALWPLAAAAAVGELPVSGLGQMSAQRAAVVLFFLGWIPLFFTLYRCRRGGWLMLAASAGPLMIIAWALIFIPFTGQ
ncbi:MAG: hypothetical protein ABFS86_19255 [Planctomycetota bacterium]